MTEKNGGILLLGIPGIYVFTIGRYKGEKTSRLFQVFEYKIRKRYILLVLHNPL